MDRAGRAHGGSPRASRALPTSLPAPAPRGRTTSLHGAEHGPPCSPPGEGTPRGHADAHHVTAPSSVLLSHAALSGGGQPLRGSVLTVALNRVKEATSAPEPPERAGRPPVQEDKPLRPRPLPCEAGSLGGSGRQRAARRGGGAPPSQVRGARDQARPPLHPGRTQTRWDETELTLCPGSPV